jgi:hypothetical protein
VMTRLRAAVLTLLAMLAFAGNSVAVAALM